MTRLTDKIINEIYKANADFNLWNRSSKLLLGVSGGKDSLALFRLLEIMKIKFEAVHVRLGKEFDISFIEKNNISCNVLETNIYDKVSRKKKNICFSCSRKRRKRLLEYAQKHNFNQVIFAHHKNDVVETYFLNQIFSRETSTMLPKQIIFDGLFQILRPLFYVDEMDLLRFTKEQGLIISKNPCKNEGKTKRSYIKKLLRNINDLHAKIDVIDNVFNSIFNVNYKFLPRKLEDK